jgi:acetyltransferase
MMEQTKVFAALQGVRGRRPVDVAALEQLMVRFSQLVSEQHMIKEVDINPLLASPDGLVALDARIVLQGPEVRLETLPKMAIRRYPTRYISQWTLKNGMEVTIRPIRPEDEPLMAAFHETLSEQSVYYRWLHMINLTQRISHERLTRICFIDYDREMALVADYKEPESGKHTIIGVGRLTRLRGANEAEFATIVSDKYQGLGLGSELLRRLIQVGRTEKLTQIVGFILPENRDMQRVCEKLGFKHHYSIEDQLVKVELAL